jgi:hypothetical protein
MFNLWGKGVLPGNGQRKGEPRRLEPFDPSGGSILMTIGILSKIFAPLRNPTKICFLFTRLVYSLIDVDLGIWRF